MKRVFIVNATAGQGKAIEVGSAIKNIFKDDQDVSVYYTSDKQETRNVAKLFSKSNDVIYSVGGDGTLSDVVNGMAKGNAKLGIVPCGSGNDFFRSIDENTDRINLGKVNDEYFINIVSFGIDAEIADCVNKMKNDGSKLLYPKGIFRTLPKFQCPTVYCWDVPNKITLLAICNGRYYGNGFKIAPDAELDDDVFNMYTVSATNKLGMINLAAKLINGTHGDSPKVRKNYISDLQVYSLAPLKCNVDGEILEGTEFNISLQPNSIFYHQEDNEKLKRLIKKS